MEMGVQRVRGRTRPSRVSPAPTSSTQRRHDQIARVGRGGRVALIETLRASPGTDYGRSSV